ncbi:MAG: 16S rRNA (cytosine(1402)-N(4))-methyltransferase RsmH [Candidatus Babeliales bacterium]
MNTSAQTYHIPVLVEEVLTYLNPQPNGIYVDCTFGGGGHTRAILLKEPTCRVIAMDWDLKAFELNGEQLQEEFGDRLEFVWSNFAQIEQKLKPLALPHIDGILADFGTSQYQIKSRPGFSFSIDTPLDMRMSPSHQKTTAAMIINHASEKELQHIFTVYGEEYKSRHIVDAILKERVKKPFKTTKQLADLLEKITPRAGRKIHPATKIFQALRIAVNHELEQIEALLPAALRLLAPGGRLVCISFHSLEDRLVKQYFREREKEQNSEFVVLTERVVVAGEKELAENPSSRSAKLRAIEKIKP